MNFTISGDNDLQRKFLQTLHHADKLLQLTMLNFEQKHLLLLLFLCYYYFYGIFDLYSFQKKKDFWNFLKYR